MKFLLKTAAVVSVLASHSQAQNYATSAAPDGVSTSISTGQRVERVYSAAIEPATTSEISQVYSVPTYEAYEPSGFDQRAYEAATERMPIIAPSPASPSLSETASRPYGETVDVTPTDDFSQPLGSPQTFASVDPAPADGEVTFAEETETSRLLIALEDTYAKRVAELKVKHLTVRKALLDGFEKDAADPKKVIGLAERMGTALAEADAAHQALLKVEESQYTAAMLSVLDAAPTRVN